jgi:misacylated tRNA(Ala) deacylase
MAVKPPIGQGKVRLIRISGLDLQPCGGTHVASTAEIGEVVVTKIQKKGRLNRRVSIELVDPTS